MYIFHQINQKFQLIPGYRTKRRTACSGWFLTPIFLIYYYINQFAELWWQFSRNICLFCGLKAVLLKCVLTAPSMMRTMSHLKVQMQIREGGHLRGTWDRVQTGHKKMARKPVSNSWLSHPAQIIIWCFRKSFHTLRFSREMPTRPGGSVRRHLCNPTAQWGITYFIYIVLGNTNSCLASTPSLLL